MWYLSVCSVEFTALVEVHVLVLDRRSRGETFKEGSNPNKGSTFSYSGFTVKTTGEMVASEHVTGLTIEASVIERSVPVLGLLAGESKIKTESLVGGSSFASSIRSGSTFLHLGLDANGAGLKNRIGMMELGDAVDKFMGIIKMFITYMIEPLMPKKAFGRNM